MPIFMNLYIDTTVYNKAALEQSSTDKEKKEKKKNIYYIYCM